MTDWYVPPSCRNKPVAAAGDPRRGDWTMPREASAHVTVLHLQYACTLCLRSEPRVMQSSRRVCCPAARDGG